MVRNTLAKIKEQTDYKSEYEPYISFAEFGDIMSNHPRLASRRVDLNNEPLKKAQLKIEGSVSTAIGNQSVVTSDLTS